MTEQTLNIMNTPFGWIDLLLSLHIRAGFFIGDIMGIPEGYCQCGCGEKTSIAKRNRKELGHVKDKPIKFIVGHIFNIIDRNKINHPIGKDNPNWKGGIYNESKRGYSQIYKPYHPRSISRKYVRLHIVIAEKALGKYLNPKHPIHHYGEKYDDHKIVICEDTAYHQLLHQRTRAYKVSGHANWRKCKYCKQYDDPDNLIFYSKTAPFHRGCHNIYQNNRYHRNI